ncbi:MAG: hypothetical protein WC522_08335 [Candidatus Omnitrophota bacterium]
MKRLITVSILVMALSISVGEARFASAGETVNGGEEWMTLETGYLTIYYPPDADLGLIEADLRKRAAYFSTDMPGDDAPAEEKIRYQLDALFRRAEDILDMRPADIHIKIKIFRTIEELKDEYARIFDGIAPREGLKSFYIHKYSTIYASEADMSDSVIAHEMAHAIVDHYFAVIPPEKVRELLASYVDLHLAE